MECSFTVNLNSDLKQTINDLLGFATVLQNLVEVQENKPTSNTVEPPVLEGLTAGVNEQGAKTSTTPVAEEVNEAAYRNELTLRASKVADKTEQEVVLNILRKMGEERISGMAFARLAEFEAELKKVEATL